MTHIPQKKTLVKVDCTGCSYCCDFVLLKVARPNMLVRAKGVAKRDKHGDLMILGDRKFYDATFFGFHNIKITPSKLVMLYKIPRAYKVFWKVVEKELWFKVNARCKKLNTKTKLCKIYNRRPEVCKKAACVLQVPNFKGLYEMGWKEI